MIVAYSRHCMGPMAVPPHHQTCLASQCKKFGPKWGLLTWFAMCWIRSPETAENAVQPGTPALFGRFYPNQATGVPPWCRGTKSWPWNCLKRAVRAMGADNIACRAIFEQFGPEKCMVGPHILQRGCFERQRKVAQSARWGYATTPKIPHRTFLRNGFEDIVCGIHPRELLQIQIYPILIPVSLVLGSVG